MASSVLFAQRRLGYGASNGLTQRGAKIGFGTDTPQVAVQISGDAIVSGLITDSNYNPIVGAIANWLVSAPPPTFGAGTSGASFAYTTQKGLYRASGNEIVYNVNVGANVLVGATTPTADFTLALPYVYGAGYESNAIIGEMWMTVYYGAQSNVFKALARANPADPATANVRYLTGTTEQAMGTITAGATLNLQGTLLYTTTSSTRLMPPTAATVTSQALTSNLAPVFGSALTWRPSPSAPALTVPGTAFPASYFTPTAAVGQVRYLGTDVGYQVRMTGTIATQPGGASNYTLSLPYPADLAATYPAETIIGELWVSVTSAETLATPGGSNNFKAFARTIAGNANAVTVRVLSGTTEDTLASVPVGATVSLQGTLSYETTTVYNGDVYTSYIPPVFSQDFAGQVTVNGSGYPPRGQLDVIGTSATAPALVADARGTANPIAEFRSGGNVMLTLGRDGVFYDSNMTASFIPSGMVQWAPMSASAPPTISAGTGASLSNVDGSGTSRMKYGGNAVSYQFERTFVVTGASPLPVSASNYTLALPYALSPSAYPLTSNVLPTPTGTSIGSLVLTVTNAAATTTTTFAGYAQTVPGQSNYVNLRYINGTTDSTLSEFSANSRVTVRGTLDYASVQVTAPLSPNVASNVLYRDDAGRASVGTGVGPRARLDVSEAAPASSSVPALMAESTGGGDILRLRGANDLAVGAASVVVDGTGEVGIGTTIPQGLLDVRATAAGGAGVGAPGLLVDASGNVGIGTTLPDAALAVTAMNPVKVTQTVVGVEFPPAGASNAGAYADYTDVVASIDAGSPMTLVEFPPVGLTANSVTISGAFYGNGAYVASASSEYSGENAYYLFNKLDYTGGNWANSVAAYNTTTGNFTGATSTSGTDINGGTVAYTGEWVQILLPNAIILKKYSIASRPGGYSRRAPRKWTILGSTNGTSWFYVDQRTNITDWASITPSVLYPFSINNSGLYNYYRLIVQEIQTSNDGYVNLQELRIFADIPLPTTAREYPPLPMTANTSYLNGTYGAGTYVASASSILAAGVDAYYAFNKIAVSDDCWHTPIKYNSANGSYTGNVSTLDSLTKTNYFGEYLQLNCPNQLLLTSYAITPRQYTVIAYTSGNGPRIFYLLGSIDGVLWELIDSRNDVPATSYAVRNFNVSISKFYKSFRLVINAIGTGGTSELYVAFSEFKLFGTQSTYPKYRTAIPSTSTTYNPGTYATYANTQYNATTVDAAPPLFVSDKALAVPWKTGASNYTIAADASPVPSVFFELPAQIRLSSYRMTAPDTSEAPSAWSVYGSNMNVAGGWLLLDARTSIVSPWATALTQTFSLASPTSAFNFFKVDLLRNCATVAPGDFIALNELRLIGDDVVPESRLAIGADGRVAVNVAASAVNASAAMTVGGNLAVNGSIRADNLGMFRNRIINGDMRLDQRFAGASTVITTVGVYTADRWRVSEGATTAALTVQRVRAPANPYGHVYALSAIATTAQATMNNQDYVTLEQRIEGYNIADFGWGGAYAQPVTVSFAAYSTQAGQYSLSLRNATNTASYVASFTVPVANQWVQVQQTIPGETSGTWEVENGLGLSVVITLAAGSNWVTSDVGRWQESSRAPSGFGYIAATGGANFMGTVNNQFYLTGVQVEKGTIMTVFEARPLGVELQLCQRYYEKSYNLNVIPGTNTDSGIVYWISTSDNYNHMLYAIKYSVCKRTLATVDTYALNGEYNLINWSRSGANGTGSKNNFINGDFGTAVFVNIGASWTPGYAQFHWTAQAEL
jgi:hypothetical protein